MTDEYLLEGIGRFNTLLQRYINIDALALYVMRETYDRRLCNCSWLTSADSTSAVPSLWPEILITSSIRPISQ